MAVLLKNFRTTINQSVINDFGLYSTNKYYVYESKVDTWLGVNSTDRDSNPPDPIDSVKDEFDVWRNLIGVKRITSQNTRRVISRYDWEINTKYDQYEHDKDLSSKKFYVLASTNRVYKCISNNGGVASTVEPYGTTTETIETDDGYLWKFMYQLTESDLEFLTFDYMPVPLLTETAYSDVRSLQLAVQNASIHGGIYFIELTVPGGSYEGVISPGGGTDASLDPTPMDDEEPGSYEFHLRQKSDGGGTDATYAPGVNDFYNDNFVVHITSGPGEGQVRTIVDYDGSTGIATLDTPWIRKVGGDGSNPSTYKILPRLEITGDGTDAEAIAVMETGTDETKFISKIKIINKGQNYTTAGVTFYRKNTGVEDSTAVVEIAPPGGHGFNAANELGAVSSLLLAKIKGNENGDFASEAKFRRYGLIRNPLLRSTGKIAGDETIRTKTLVVKNHDAITNIHFERSTDAGHQDTEPINTEGWTNWPLSSGYEDVKNLFPIGKKVSQGADSDPHQARGTVVEWDWKNLVLKVRGTNGRFLDSDETSDPIVIVDAESTDIDAPWYTDISYVDRPKTLTNDSFIVGHNIVGNLSKATAEIVSWDVSTDGLTGKLQIKQVQGNFTQPYIDPTGVEIEGETVSRFSDINNDGQIESLFYRSNGELIMSSAQITGLSEDAGNETLESYRQTFKLNLERNSFTRAGFTETTFNVGDTVTGNYSQSTGKVVSWTITEYRDTDDVQAVKGVLELTDVRKKFTVPESTDFVLTDAQYPPSDANPFSTDDTLYIETDDGTDSQKEELKDNSGTLSNAKVVSVTLPELLKGSGEVLYIENVQPIQRGDDQTEELKMLIRF